MSDLRESWSVTVIKNFEEVKKQLSELSEVVNKFKSEQVQLKIVELIFQGARDDSGHHGRADAAPARRTRRAGKKAALASTAVADLDTKKKVQRSKGTGPVPTLEQLIADGFFSKPRTIGAIVEHCRTDLARTIKPNDMSGPLGRFVRDKKLSRSKNAEGQFEYVKK